MLEFEGGFAASADGLGEDRPLFQSARGLSHRVFGSSVPSIGRDAVFHTKILGLSRQIFYLRFPFSMLLKTLSGIHFQPSTVRCWYVEKQLVFGTSLCSATY